MRKIIALTLVCLVLMSTVAFAAEFKDMPEAGHWSTSALEAAVENGLLTGNDGYVFPDDNMTRAEMATIMARACGATNDADISSFTDVSTSDWYYSSMAKAVAMKAFTGSDNKLNPENYITRQEAFVVLARVFALDKDEKIDLTVLDNFKDKDKIDTWAKNGVASIISKGYVGGADGLLSPLANITRAEFAVVMDRLVKYYIDDPDTTEIPADGNVMIRVGGLKLDNVANDNMVILGDGVGASEVSISNADIKGNLVVRGGKDVSLDGTFGEVRTVMPNIRVSGDHKKIGRIYTCPGSKFSMGNTLTPDMLEGLE